MSWHRGTTNPQLRGVGLCLSARSKKLGAQAPREEGAAVGALSEMNRWNERPLARLGSTAPFGGEWEEEPGRKVPVDSCCAKLACS